MPTPTDPSRAIVPRPPLPVPVGNRSHRRGRSVTRWHPPDQLRPPDINAIIEAASSERDRLFLRVLWCTGSRTSEVLALRPVDVQRYGLHMPNRKNPSLPFKTVALPAAAVDLPGELLIYAQEHGIGPREPIFASRLRGPRGERRPIGKVQAWRIVKAASVRAGVFVAAMRASRYGPAGDPAPVHPHLFRHARVRQTLRHTNGNISLAMKQAGWAFPATAYLRLSDTDAAEMMQGVPE